MGRTAPKGWVFVLGTGRGKPLQPQPLIQLSLSSLKSCADSQGLCRGSVLGHLHTGRSSAWSSLPSLASLGLPPSPWVVPIASGCAPTPCPQQLCSALPSFGAQGRRGSVSGFVLMIVMSLGTK